MGQHVENREYPPFSVAMCVYGGDRPEWFGLAVQSLLSQTVLPEEIVLVVDGPIPPELEEQVALCEKGCADAGIRLVLERLAVNSGHGVARKTGLEHCSCAIIALMDADDICVTDRFETELSFLLESEADVVGGDLAEFSDKMANVISYRRVPKSDREIKEYMQKRCPLNQCTVMFQRAAYDRAGGYLDWFCEEDYYLWVRMCLQGVTFANTGTLLVYARVLDQSYQRRGGLRYFRSEARLQKYMYDHRMISLSRYVRNVLTRLVLQVILPNRLRSWVFRNFARDKV